MTHLLVETPRIDQSPKRFIESVGRVFKTFGPPLQDSGNVSYGVEINGRCFFVKTTDPNAAVLLDHSMRVELLRNAIELAGKFSDPVLPALLHVIESPDGPMLVYEWVDGDLLRDTGTEAGSTHQRFRHLPAEEILQVLDQIFELHAKLADAGWVAVDFYDGCLLYDFACRTLHIVDLDHYHRGSFRNAMGRMFGSSRFMAPEELVKGEWIDQRTTLFNMGRTAAILLADGSLNRQMFRGGEALYQVVDRACTPKPDDRFDSMRDFHDAWLWAR